VARDGQTSGTGSGVGGGRRVVVVGPCASGKTTLVHGLRDLGYDAAVCAQEHSDIPTLWQRGRPDVLIALDVDLATIRRRRGEDWPEAVYAVQRRRLAPARAAASAVLDASTLSVTGLLAAAARAIREADVRCQMSDVRCQENDGGC
jgi:RNase adaptor protein for sRNA GlmZ degradation